MTLFGLLSCGFAFRRIRFGLRALALLIHLSHFDPLAKTSQNDK
jgi:hypothetical protein